MGSEIESLVQRRSELEDEELAVHGKLLEPLVADHEAREQSFGAIDADVGRETDLLHHACSGSGPPRLGQAYGAIRTLPYGTSRAAG